MIKVVIADDHKMFRQGLRMLFEEEMDIKVVGEACDGLEAEDMALSLEPDVILMDIDMPGADGLTAMKVIMEKRPESAIIILTMHREEGHVFEAIKLGARGYVLKDADSAEVMRSIRVVASGGSVIDGYMAGKLFQEFRTVSQKVEKENEEGLTPRELDILALIVAGASNREIGEKLFLAEKTIKNYITSIFQKLQTNDRTQAAVYAIQRGLVSPKEIDPLA
jgi:DNA-binding NarL/FixJ family response regulator